MWRALALGLVVAGCHASLADDPGELTSGVDASQPGSQLDASGSGGGIDRRPG